MPIEVRHKNIIGEIADVFVLVARDTFRASQGHVSSSALNVGEAFGGYDEKRKMQQAHKER